MNVFHGSYTHIGTIDLTKANPHKDFGKGFYVTRHRSQAQAWADRVGREHGCDGVVTDFVFRETAFDNPAFKTLRFSAYTEEWLDFIVLNRNLGSPSQAHDFDIVDGPVANDRVASRITRYLRGLISRSDFLADLVYHEPSHQICFCTTKSLQMLEQPDMTSISRLEDISKSVIQCIVEELNIVEEQALDLFYTSGTYAVLCNESTLDCPQWNKDVVFTALKSELDL